MSDNVIGDRYVLGPLLGRGGMAEVRRARDTRLERDVAIKRLKADLAGDPVFQERFRREAHAAAGLNHPNIVSVFDTGESFDEASGLMIPYIVMELVLGHTLREILHDGRKIQPIKALELTQCVLDALDYSHRHGIIHRDIKPANVMLTNNGQVKVMDFGIARAVSDTAASMTQTASVIGTPQYLSPEQIRGETVDRRSDVYSTGCLLYELLTGKPPFEGDSPVSLAYQHVRAIPVPPSQVDPLVSTQMDAITLKALAKNSADRYQTAHDMYEDIGRLLAGQKVQAVVPPPGDDEALTEVMDSPDKTQVMPTAATAKAAPLPARALATQEEEQPSHLGRTIGIVVAAILVIALVTTGVVYALNRNNGQPLGGATPTTLISVPRVLSMDQQNAVQTIESRNLKAIVSTFYGEDDATAGTVTEQDPPDGTMVDPGSSVTIKVNLGSQKFTVPNVVGQTTDDATSTLKKTFTNVTAQPAPTEGPTDTAGTVLSTDPAAGSMATKDQLITVYYATGQVTLPNLIGYTRDKAMIELGSLGFSNDNILVVPQESSSTEGTVVEMIPDVGSVVAKDSQVTILVATPFPTMSASPTPTSTTTPTSSSSPTSTTTGPH
ncbi:MAG: Stk1 family PASTA domain-containing Ser/Thr kinase [Propionibacteriaceae bacterium]|nr:Stk1 family PASTA domain-containing Ser/Thr kinase [Propionibacteriaceae bacterium]